MLDKKRAYFQNNYAVKKSFKIYNLKFMSVGFFLSFRWNFNNIITIEFDFSTNSHKGDIVMRFSVVLFVADDFFSCKINDRWRAGFTFGFVVSVETAETNCPAMNEYIQTKISDWERVNTIMLTIYIKLLTFLIRFDLYSLSDPCKLPIVSL